MKLHEQHLFQLAQVQLRSKRSWFKIECDALTNESWACLAEMGSHIVASFHRSDAIPKGGNKLADAIAKYEMPYHGDGDDRYPRRVLICDDVCTTGASFERRREEVYVMYGGDTIVHGLVAFNRGTLPSWVDCIFDLNERVKRMS